MCIFRFLMEMVMKTYNDPERVERQHLCYFTKAEERIVTKHTVLVLNLNRF